MELKEKSTSVDALQELISTIVDCERKARISPGLCAGAFCCLSLQQELNRCKASLTRMPRFLQGR